MITQSLGKILNPIFAICLVFIVLWTAGTKGYIAILLLPILYLPLLVTGINNTKWASVVFIIFAAAITSIEVEFGLSILWFLIVPSIVSIWLDNYLKDPRIIRVFVTHFTSLSLLTFVFWGQSAGGVSIYDSTYDYIRFLFIAAQENLAPTIATSMNVDSLAIVAYFLPSIFCILWGVWFNSNYILAKKLLGDNTNVDNKYPKIQPWWYNTIFIMIAVSAFISNNLFETSNYVMYTLYNVLVIFWVGYFRYGLLVCWGKLSNFLLKTLFILVFLLMSLEVFIFMCFLGFFISVKFSKTVG